MTNIIINISTSTTLALALIEAVEAHAIADTYFGVWSDDASELQAARRNLLAAEQAVAAHTGIVCRDGGRTLWAWAYAQAGVEPAPLVLI